MLKNVDPLLSPELLFVLAAMGHGDEIAVVDANFPAYSVAGSTRHGRVVSLPGTSMPQVVEAILSVLPLDESVETPMRTMAAATDGLAEVQKEVQVLINASAARHWSMGVVERFGFYEAARSCYAVVLTGERRLFGNVLIKKGVVLPRN